MRGLRTLMKMKRKVKKKRKDKDQLQTLVRSMSMKIKAKLLFMGSLQKVFLLFLFLISQRKSKTIKLMNKKNIMSRESREDLAKIMLERKNTSKKNGQVELSII